MNNLPLRFTCRPGKQGSSWWVKRCTKGKELWCRDSSGITLSGVRGGMLCLDSPGVGSRSIQQISEEPGLGKEGTLVSVPLL